MKKLIKELEKIRDAKIKNIDSDEKMKKYIVNQRLVNKDGALSKKGYELLMSEKNYNSSRRNTRLTVGMAVLTFLTLSMAIISGILFYNQIPKKVEFSEFRAQVDNEIYTKNYVDEVINHDKSGKNIVIIGDNYDSGEYYNRLYFLMRATGDIQENLDVRFDCDFEMSLVRVSSEMTEIVHTRGSKKPYFSDIITFSRMSDEDFVTFDFFSDAKNFNEKRAGCEIYYNGKSEEIIFQEKSA